MERERGSITLAVRVEVAEVVVVVVVVVYMARMPIMKPGKLA